MSEKADLPLDDGVRTHEDLDEREIYGAAARFMVLQRQGIKSVNVIPLSRHIEYETCLAAASTTATTPSLTSGSETTVSTVVPHAG